MLKLKVTGKALEAGRSKGIPGQLLTQGSHAKPPTQSDPTSPRRQCCIHGHLPTRPLICISPPRPHRATRLRRTLHSRCVCRCPERHPFLGRLRAMFQLLGPDARWRHGPDPIKRPRKASNDPRKRQQLLCRRWRPTPENRGELPFATPRLPDLPDAAAAGSEDACPSFLADAPGHRASALPTQLLKGLPGGLLTSSAGTSPEISTLSP